MTVPVPILLYHSVSTEPAPIIAPFAVTPATFRRQLDMIVEAGLTPMTVRAYVETLEDEGRPLPERPVVMTFDDGWADFTDAAAALAERHVVATLYVTTGLLQGGARGGTMLGVEGRHGLAWDQLPELARLGIEIGAHTVSHPQLDAIPIGRARGEILRSRHLLEDSVQDDVVTFAYPHGYSSRAVRDVVALVGFRGACGVKDALSSRDDDRFCLGRLTVRRTTSLERFGAWLHGVGAPVAPRTERVPTRLWRGYRRSRAYVSRAGGP